VEKLKKINPPNPMKEEMNPKKKEIDMLREWALDHQRIAGVIERLLDAGWLDHERIADTIASHLIENPYGVNPNKKLIEKEL
jgi:SOS response regulatory protein OraA/RecX